MARTCRTCKHYEPSAVWRRGWCRNPRLYSPQHSHLVDQDGLDCSRGLGNHWESADDDGDRTQVAAAGTRSPLRLFAPQPRLVAAGMVANSSGGGGFGGGRGGGTAGGPPRPPERGGPPGQERAVSYQPEERYWTDYLRIALPVIGLMLMLGLLWYWTAAVITGDETGTEPTETPIVQPTEVNQPTPTATPMPTIQVQVVPGGVETPAPVSPTPTPVVQPVDPVGTFGFATEDGVNLRSMESVESATVQVLSATIRLQVTGAAVTGTDGRVWIPVTLADNPNVAGFVAQDFFRPE